MLRIAIITVLVCAACGEQPPSRPPNIVLILADDMGWSDAGCYGNDSGATPAIDRLARDGLRFTQFYASSPVCMPTRFSLMTGRYPNRDGVNGLVQNQFVPGIMRYWLARLLRDAGYATGLVGKWHLGLHAGMRPWERGFDTFRGFLGANLDYVNLLDWQGRPGWMRDQQVVQESDYLTHLINRSAVEFVEQHRDRPFFLFLSHAAVHAPYQAPGDAPMREPGQGTLRAAEMPTDIGPTYAAMLAEMDRGIGELLDTLERLDLSDDTLIVFLSDNGPRRMGSTAPLQGLKGSIWEGGIRVPAIACWPGRIPAGEVSDAVAVSHDLAPTFLEAAGIVTPDGQFDGASLLDLVTEGRPLASRPLFWLYRHTKNELRAAMREGDWKLIIAPGRAMLFDLADDPAETHDLAGEHPERAAEMLSALSRWAATVASTDDLPRQLDLH